MSLIYHKCNPKHLDILVKISKETFIDAFEKDNNPDDFKTYIDNALSKNQLEKELLNPNCLFYLAYEAQELVGYFKLNVGEAQNETFETSSIELERIYVTSQHQNRGLGKHLLNQIISIVKTKAVSFLWLGVWEENKAAIKFYERHGFKKFSSHPYYIGKDKQTDWLMRLKII